MIRRLGRILWFLALGFVIGSLFLVALYREVPPPGTPLMLIRAVEGYGIDVRTNAPRRIFARG